MRVVFLLILISSFHIAAQNVVLQYDTLFACQNSGLCENPALFGLRQLCSKTDVALSFKTVHYDKSPNLIYGNGVMGGAFEAFTYNRLKNATVTGLAIYDNGIIYDMHTGETSDAALLYPYLTADSKGGDLKHERYVFGGSYSSDFKNNGLYGVAVRYDAIQDYRSVDPRPKNTVGKLCFSGAAGLSLGSYTVALDVDLVKYKQTNSIIFKSELGEDKLFHATGLGTYSQRFSGQGKTSVYGGYGYGVRFDIAPRCGGVFANISFDRFSFNKHLAELNYLPIVKAVDNNFVFEGGWSNNAWVFKSKACYGLRRGYENIFGDASGQVYPLIATVDGYTKHQYACCLSAMWRRLTPLWRIDAVASVEYVDKAERYRDIRSKDIKTVGVGVESEYVRLLKRFCVHSALTCKFYSPIYHRIDGFDDDHFLTVDEIYNYYVLSAWRTNVMLRCGADYNLGHSKLLGFRFEAGFYNMKYSDGLSFNASIIFTI